VIAVLVVILLAIAGTVAYVVVKLGVFDPSLSEQVGAVEKADGSWWLGKQFEGLPITLAKPAGGERVDDLGYGTCERFGGKLDPFASTRCGYPLLVQVRKRTYDLALDDLPKRLDGSCGRTTVRGAPVLIVPDGAVLYTGDVATAVLGRPDQVGRALGRLATVGGSSKLETPSPGVDALQNCVKVAHPFTSLASRLAALRANPGVPLAWMGEWYAGGRLTGAERTGKTAVLTYTSCGSSSDLGSCLETMSLSSEAAVPANIRATLEGATCRTFTVGGAPGVVWTKDLAGDSGGGAFVFTGDDAITFANDITLEGISISQVRPG
jgi:hypothetical protein